jgi:hypothetical protein
MMMAILKLGGTYLSFSTNYPEQQIVRIVGNVRPLLIVTESDAQITARFDCVKHICEIVPIHLIVNSSIEFGDDPNDPGNYISYHLEYYFFYYFYYYSTS